MSAPRRNPGMSRGAIRRRLLAAAVGAVAVVGVSSAANAEDVSAPAILQWFDGSWQTMQNRMPDYFMAGYGGLWTPPPYRADSGNQSVGYDVYNRFDLGSPGNPTQYGTEQGLKSMIAELHKTGGRAYLDLVWNHNGFSQWSTTDGSGNTFLNAGGYPGFSMGIGTNGNFGDFHDPSASGDEQTQLAGLIDIAQESNNQYIRNPVNPGDPNNIPAGTQAAYGRLANVPTSANARFYQDQSSYITVTDPRLGPFDSNGNPIPFKIYNFTNNPNGGVPVTENATGYLMRNARWLIQDIGADGFRMDATKNYPDWVLNYLDQAVYGAIQTPLLDGSRQNVWSFGEAFDTNPSVLQPRIRHDISSASVVGGNRDTLDFPLYYAMQSNLSNNGFQNDWTKVTNASIDENDDGLANNGSQGVAFVQSADATGSPPYLANVAYAYTLTRPGNAIVYFNGNEFGTRQNDFPQQGRGDALGGQYGNAITTLVDIRNRYGTGNYIPRSVTSSTTSDKEDLVFERDRSMIVALSNRLDDGYDNVTVQTGFRAGMPLIELTGNAADPAVDPDDNIPSLVVVNGDGTVNLSIPRNKNVNGVEHDKGYVIYGPSGPQGSLSLSNVAQQIAPDTQNSSNNGTARLTKIDVIKSNSFTATLNTNKVYLLGSYRDHDADGDNALIKMDGGIDLNDNGHVDYVAPDTVTYGFEDFTTTHSPGYTSADNNGVYAQTIDASKLSEGYHYIEVRAFRHRDPSLEGADPPPIYSSFKDVIYVDRLPPNSAPDSIELKPGGSSNDIRFNVRSVDQTANNMYVLTDLPASVTNSQILSMLDSGNQATQTDVDLWARDVNNETTGNHVLTVVSYEITGNYNIQRYPGQYTQTVYGTGLGDCDRNDIYNANDVTNFTTYLKSNNTQFNPTADLNGDGLIDLTDTFMYGPRLDSVGANSATMSAYDNLLQDPYVTGGSWTVSGSITADDVTAGTTTVPGLTTLSTRSMRGHALYIQDGGHVVVRPDGTSAGTSYVDQLSIGNSASLDLNDNDLVVKNGSFSAVRALVKSGYSAVPDSSKSGIISTTSQDSGGKTILELVDNALAGYAEWPTGSGQTVSADAIIGKYTYFGDTNLDGQVTGDDYSAVDANLGTAPPPGEAILMGDTNFDGQITGDDYSFIDADLGLGVGSPMSAPAAPEPSSLAFLAVGGLAALRRRIRRKTR